MENVSIGLGQDLMIVRLIRNVRVIITRSLYETCIDKHHHGLSADMLARKCGIVLDNAKSTLKSTTQDNVISALNPLIWRYRTDFLSQRLC